MLVVLVMLVLVNQVGWVMDLGDYSQRARDARQDRLETKLFNSRNIGGQWSVFDVDFRTQPDVTDKHLDRENRFWTEDRPFYLAQMGAHDHEGNWKIKAFTTTWIRWGGNPGEGISYCTVALNHTLYEFYNATPGSWSTRGDAALDRKSARMQRDYEVAAMTTTALRSTPTHMELHRPIKQQSQESSSGTDIY